MMPFPTRARRLAPTARLSALGLSLSVAAALACTSPNPAVQQSETPEAAVGTPAPAVRALATRPAGDLITVTDALSTTALITPTATATPVPTATRAPTSTPVPTSAALQPAASTLATKLAAYRVAVRQGGNLDDTLRLQRELLAASDEAATAIKEDKSRPADSLRRSVADIQAGIAGDNNRLDAAERALSLGAAASAGAATGVVTTPVAGTTLTVGTLNEKLASFRKAVQDRNSGDALRLQGEMLTGLTALEQSAQKDDSEKGRSLRDALANLHKGLDGDSERLTAATTALGRLGGTAAPTDQKATDTPRLAASLAAKLDAFQTAVAAGDRTELIRLQRDILAETDQDDAALRLDQSADAVALRESIATIRAGVSGDLGKLDGVRANLGKVAGEPAADAAANVQPITDLPRFVGELDKKVVAYQEAIQKNDTGAMLRLQRELIDDTDRADVALKNVQSKPAEELRGAIASIRTAFSGDLSKLDEARFHIRAVSGDAARTTGGAPPAAGATRVDVPTNEMRNRLNTLRDAVRDKQPPEEIAKRRETLKAEVAKVEDALKDAQGPKADRLRDALGAAREAAAGDDAKIDTAAKLLEAAGQ
jgi:hypothetical protein